MTTITTAQITSYFGTNDHADTPTTELRASFEAALQERRDRNGQGLDTEDQEWAIARYRTVLGRR